MRLSRLIAGVLCLAAAAAFIVPTASAAEIVRPIEDIGRVSTSARYVDRTNLRRDFEDGRDAGLRRDESFFDRHGFEETWKELSDECAAGALRGAASTLVLDVLFHVSFNFHDTLQSALDGCLGRALPEPWAGAASAAIAGDWTGAALRAARAYPTVGMFRTWLLLSAAAIP